MGQKCRVVLLWALVAVVAMATAAGDSQAKKRGKRGRDRAKARSAALNVEHLRSELAGADGLRAQAAADRLATAGKRQLENARSALQDALAVGLAPDVAIASLDALANLGKGADLGIVKLYLSHRRPSVRATALSSMAVLALPTAEGVIVGGLRDRELEVRKTAAGLIAEYKLKSGIGALVALLRRGEEDVIGPLGKLASAELAQAVADLQEKAPDRLVAKALGAMLLNPKFGPDDVRLEVVQILGGIPGGEAVKALDAYVASIPPSSKRESRAEALAASEKRRSGGGR